MLFRSVGAGAAGALNMWYDADIDAVMSRTRGRPVPRGRVTRGEALAFGMTLVIVEQDINRALAAAQRVYCFQKGHVSLAGPTAGVDRQAITQAYFGL